MSMLSEAAQRTAIVAGARSWVGTPYHHNAAVKGSGVDCARILMEVWAEAGLIERFDPGNYAFDWHMHRDEERYLATVERFCGRVDESEAPLVARGPDFSAEPGDLLLWRWGRTYSHSAIVTAWPFAVHAYADAHVVLEEDVTRVQRMVEQPVRVYSFWRKA